MPSARESDPVEVSWTSKDALLYAVGIGAGTEELAFTTENIEGRRRSRCSRRSPSSSAGGRGGVDAQHRHVQLRHARPRPAGRDAAPADARRGHRHARRRASSRCTTRARPPSWSPRPRPRWTASRCTPAASSMFIRGEGGWGGERGPSGPQNVPPERAPDHEVTYQTSPDQALVYRLSGDRNPLHSDPAFAAMGGFDRPILHGLCTLRLHRPGPAARAVRLRPGAVPPHRGPLRLTGPARRGADGPGLGDGRRRGRVHHLGRRPVVIDQGLLRHS